jgi:hypothetical protein
MRRGVVTRDARADISAATSTSLPATNLGNASLCAEKARTRQQRSLRVEALVRPRAPGPGGTEHVSRSRQDLLTGAKIG